MSRNRNVRKKLDNNIKTLANSSNSNLIVPRKFEQRTWNSNLHENKSGNYVFDSINSTLYDSAIEFSDNLSTSSSSLSWAEDCEADATKLVAEEYERMLRVLQRLEPIPPNYDKEEYKLWIKTFPCLSLIDRHSASSIKTITNTDEDYYSRNWFSASHSKPTSLKTDSVILNSFAISQSNEPERLRRSRSIRNVLTSNNDRNIINTTLNPMTLEEELYSFLTISNRPETRRFNNNNNNNNIHKSYAKDLRIDEDKFNSLPPLFINNAPINHNKHKRKTSAYKKSDSSQFLPVLEPDLSKYNGKFRSISAVPRDFLLVSKCPSAFSIKHQEIAIKKTIQDSLPKQRKRDKNAEKNVINEFAGFS